jgi:XTP/dITP diphosphohydrolase
MNEIVFVTGSELKFKTATQICDPRLVKLVRQDLETVEIQSETGEPIAHHKANEAFQKLQKPIVITDDSWIIPGLNGFPGPYMKSMNDWFSAQDWLNLTRSLKDREIILHQILVYQDEHEQVTFSADLKGTLLTETRGESPYTHMTVVTMNGGKTSMAETLQSGGSDTKSMHTAWHEFNAWMERRNS